MIEKHEPLSRSLGLPMLTFYGLGMILGAGIYSIIGAVAGVSGETLWLSFAIAAFCALLTAFSYAELSTMFPKAGAEYIYLTHAFQRPWLAGTAGIAMAFSGAATAATVAIAFSGYLEKFIPVPNLLTSGAVVILFTLVALVGVSASGWVNIVFTLIEVGGLVILIYLGFTSERFGDHLSALPHQGTFAGAALVIFSYFGFENIVTLAEESKKPERHLPKAILISLAVSTALYLAVSVAAVALIPPEELAKSNAALMTAAESSSRDLAKVLGGIALFSTANTALISLVGASRILYGMGDAKILPSVLAQTLKRRKTPWVSTLVILIATLLLIPLGTVETVASVSSLATMLVFLFVNIAVIRLRYSDSERKRPFRSPLSWGRLPLLACLGAILSFLFLFQFTSIVYKVGGVFILLTALAFYFLAKTPSEKGPPPKPPSPPRN